MKKTLIFFVLSILYGQSMAQLSFGVYAAPHHTTIHQKQIPYDWTIRQTNEVGHNSWGAGLYLKIPLNEFLYLKNETGYSQILTSYPNLEREYRTSEYVQTGFLVGYVPFFKRTDLLKGLSINAGSAMKYRYSGRTYFYFNKKAPNTHYSLLLGASFNYKILTLSPFADFSLTAHEKNNFYNDFHFYFRNYGLKLSCKLF